MNDTVVMIYGSVIHITIVILFFCIIIIIKRNYAKKYFNFWYYIDDINFMLNNSVFNDLTILYLHNVTRDQRIMPPRMTLNIYKGTWKCQSQ